MHCMNFSILKLNAIKKSAHVQRTSRTDLWCSRRNRRVNDNKPSTIRCDHVKNDNNFQTCLCWWHFLELKMWQCLCHAKLDEIAQINNTYQAHARRFGAFFFSLENSTIKSHYMRTILLRRLMHMLVILIRTSAVNSFWTIYRVIILIMNENRFRAAGMTKRSPIAIAICKRLQCVFAHLCVSKFRPTSYMNGGKYAKLALHCTEWRYAPYIVMIADGFSTKTNGKKEITISPFFNHKEWKRVIQNTIFCTYFPFADAHGIHTHTQRRSS